MMINPKDDNKNARRLPTELLGSVHFASVRLGRYGRFILEIVSFFSIFFDFFLQEHDMEYYDVKYGTGSVIRVKSWTMKSRWERKKGVGSTRARFWAGHKYLVLEREQPVDYRINPSFSTRAWYGILWRRMATRPNPNQGKYELWKRYL